MTIDSMPRIDTGFRNSNRIMDEWESSDAARGLKKFKNNPQIIYLRSVMQIRGRGIAALPLSFL